MPDQNNSKGSIPHDYYYRRSSLMLYVQVKLAMDTVTGELVALKIVTRASKQRKQMMMRRLQSNMMIGEDPDEQFAREIAVMSKLRHINVVQLIEVDVGSLLAPVLNSILCGCTIHRHRCP
jgi:hypothetical protein